MIKYQLICDQSHEFEGWFANSTAFEDQQKSGFLTCPSCNSANVKRALMAPNLASPKTRKSASVSVSDGLASPPAAENAPAVPAPTASLPPEAAAHMHQLMGEMRRLQAKIRNECRDVGDNFAEEARKMHYGEAEAEGIYGQATPEEREALDEEGITVLDMPWLPKDN